MVAYAPFYRITSCAHNLAQDAPRMRVELMNEQSLNLKSFYFLIFSSINVFMGNCRGHMRKYLTWHARRIEKTILLHAKCLVHVKPTTVTLRRLMSYIYMEHPFLMFLDHTQRRGTIGRTPLDE